MKRLNKPNIMDLTLLWMQAYFPNQSAAIFFQGNIPESVAYLINYLTLNSEDLKGLVGSEFFVLPINEEHGIRLVNLADNNKCHAVFWDGEKFVSEN